MSTEIVCGDSLSILRKMEPESVQCCVTSPPYFGLRDYGHDGQIGLEKTPQQYVENMVALFREVRRVLKKDGTLWLNLGDSYAANRSYQVPSTKGGKKHSPAQSVGGSGSTVPDGLKPKDLIGIPWRVAFALQADGWYLRQDIIWHKPNVMPESVRDRCTKAHEYLFLLTKSEKYFYDHAAIAEPVVSSERDILRSKAMGRGAQPSSIAVIGSPRRDQSGGYPVRDKGNPTRNKRTVWTVPTKPYKGAHFATFPPDLIRPCILAGSRAGDTVLDPFGGSGTTAQVALESGRSAILIELNPDYIPLIRERISRSTHPVEAPRQPELFV